MVTFGALPKVTRCKSGTLSGRYRSNGYVLGQIQRHGRPEGRHGSKPQTSESCVVDLFPRRASVG
ncbi:hypothetical protein PspCFBP13509_29025 [Pseudomonas sp. CFBP13509]|nr:hypothetical protein PspCFBP13509_29025 [Pseudomonas sp. CFBP13509]